MKKQRILLVGIISVGVIALLILFGWLFRKPLYRLSLGDIDARYRSAMLAYQEHRYADARKELAPWPAWIRQNVPSSCWETCCTGVKEDRQIFRKP